MSQSVSSPIIVSIEDQRKSAQLFAHVVLYKQFFLLLFLQSLQTYKSKYKCLKPNLFGPRTPRINLCAAKHLLFTSEKINLSTDIERSGANIENILFVENVSYMY